MNEIQIVSSKVPSALETMIPVSFKHMNTLTTWRSGDKLLPEPIVHTCRTEIASALSCGTPKQTAVQLSIRLLSAYPSRAADNPDDLRAYLALLADELARLPAWAVTAALPQVWRSSRWRPSVAEVIEEVSNEMAALTRASAAVANMAREHQYQRRMEEEREQHRQEMAREEEEREQALIARDAEIAAAHPGILAAGDFIEAKKLFDDTWNTRETRERFRTMTAREPAEWLPPVAEFIKRAAGIARREIRELPETALAVAEEAMVDARRAEYRAHCAQIDADIAEIRRRKADAAAGGEASA